MEGMYILSAICLHIFQHNWFMYLFVYISGREAAVDLIEKMSEGFRTITVADPNKLKSFIEATTGSAMAVMEGLNSILYSNDPDEIPLTDFERAAEMPYDTDIPEGEDPDIPEDPEEALK